MAYGTPVTFYEVVGGKQEQEKQREKVQGDDPRGPWARDRVPLRLGHDEVPAQSEYA